MKCPNCKGNGGEYMDVIYKGISGGPYEECNFCEDNGKINIFQWIYWKIFMSK